MTEKIMIALIATAGPLAGIALSELLGRWKRREEYKRILFNEKLKLYSGLIATTADVFRHLLFDKNYKVRADHFTEGKAKIAAVLFGSLLISSPEASKITGKFMAVCEAEDITLNKRIGQLAELHSALRETCEAELGLKALAKDLNRLS